MNITCKVLLHLVNVYIYVQHRKTTIAILDQFLSIIFFVLIWSLFEFQIILKVTRVINKSNLESLIDSLKHYYALSLS